MITITHDIPLNRLVHSKANVRRTGRSRAVEALMASIEAHGLRQNLNVKPTSGNRYEVVAGGRRLEALKRLMKDGKLDRATPIPCAILSDDDNAAEISLAENTMREVMHADDQCAAFQQLIDGGQSVEDTAARFGVTPSVVRQRLRLACVSPILRRKFREGHLDLAQMMAFALVDDHAAQEAVWSDLPDWNNGPDAIRRALTADSLSADDRLVQFVGLDAYEAAGGAVIRDLFGDERSAVLADAALVEQLAMARLEDEACHVKGEGWQWVNIELKVDHSIAYGRVYPEDGEIFDTADMEKAGARLTISHDGALRVDRGLVDPATMRREARSARSATPKGADAFNAVQLEDLSGHRTAALRFELARNPDCALAATVHALGLKLLYEGRPQGSCLELSARSEGLDRHVKSMSECAAHSAFARMLDDLRGQLPSDPSLFWDWCITQAQERLLTCLALMAGLSLNAVQAKGAQASGHADALAAVLSLDMQEHWLPEPDGFFARLSKPQMGAFLIESGEDQQAAVLGKLKKVEAARRTASVLTGKGWLPAPLRRVASA